MQFLEIKVSVCKMIKNKKLVHAIFIKIETFYFFCVNGLYYHLFFYICIGNKGMIIFRILMKFHLQSLFNTIKCHGIFYLILILRMWIYFYVLMEIAIVYRWQNVSEHLALMYLNVVTEREKEEKRLPKIYIRASMYVHIQYICVIYYICLLFSYCLYICVW